MPHSPRGYVQSIEIAQSPSRVFTACTEPAMLTRWYAVEASVDGRPGGTHRVRLRDGRVRDATIDVWEPGRRLRLMYFADGRLPGEDGPVIEDLLFERKAPGTMLRVLGSGVPGHREWDAEYLWLRRGWAYWLDGLKRLLESPPPLPRR